LAAWGRKLFSIHAALANLTVALSCRTAIRKDADLHSSSAKSPGDVAPAKASVLSATTELPLSLTNDEAPAGLHRKCIDLTVVAGVVARVLLRPVAVHVAPADGEAAIQF
jgi:hypothetical protein